MGTVVIGSVTFVFAEARHAGTRRAISIHRKGVANDQHVYTFDPDPHDRDYNWYSRNPAKFYDAVARAIAERVAATGMWPGAGFVVTVRAVDYTLDG